MQDEGQGIQKSEFKNLFSMFNKHMGFFRTQGIGLGLSTVKILSNAMLGGVHLNSTFQHGTEVGFSILTQRGSIAMNSKDLKAQARTMKEEFFMSRIGKIELPSIILKPQLSRLLTNKSIEFNGQAIPTTEEEYLDLFYAGPMGEDLQYLHKKWKQLEEPFLGKRTIIMIERVIKVTEEQSQRSET